MLPYELTNATNSSLFNVHRNEAHISPTFVYIMPLEHIHTPGIDVGGGWSIVCGSDPPSAGRVEELEESVRSVVRQENELEDQGEGVQNSGKTIIPANT